LFLHSRMGGRMAGFQSLPTVLFSRLFWLKCIVRNIFSCIALQYSQNITERKQSNKLIFKLCDIFWYFVLPYSASCLFVFTAGLDALCCFGNPTIGHNLQQEKPEELLLQPAEILSLN
jgi:hypothetical protein